MKKLIWLFAILISFSASFTHWTTCDGRKPCDDWYEFDSSCNCIKIDEWWNQWWWNWWNGSNWTAAANGITTNNWWNNNSDNNTETNSDNTIETPSANAYWNLWINANDKCLINWQCSLNIYETLWIRKSNTDPEVQVFVQDVVLALTTFFGTVISLILIISWLMYILSSFKSDASWASKAKKGVFGSIVWLLLVSWSYAIIRLIQFIATWWGW